MNKFRTTPDDINSFARKSASFLASTIIPHLEHEAIEILIKAGICDEAYYNPPGPLDGERWRLFWLNEALHQCENVNPVGDAGEHLEQAERAAVNVLVSASALRDALDQGNAEEAAALAMILVSDAVMGGLSIDLQETTEKHLAAKRMPYAQGLGKKQSDWEKCKSDCVNYAKEESEKDPSILISKMAEDAGEYISRNFYKYKELQSAESLPKDGTIVKWLRAAGDTGQITIPPGARKVGKPAKASA
ncbi:hypothetical protein [Acidovorax carolinensis]|uniref:hypothetical protein n=1 Tax=Acidovorax carolinensis TaxID=553814 RepID=UPI0012FF8AB5|nr:hypothetical protein [Acidovorax carolinensis]